MKLFQSKFFKAALMIVFVVAAFFLYPRHLPKDFFDGDIMSILYIQASVVDGEPVQDTEKYELTADSDAYLQVQELLSNVSYHNRIATLVYPDSYETGSDIFYISCGTHSIRVDNAYNFEASTIGKQSLYRLGYKQSPLLCNNLKSILHD